MAPPTDVLAILRQMGLFQALAPDELARLAAASHAVQAAKGQILFRRGEPCEGFHVVVYGQVKLALVNPAGGEKVVEIMGAGQSFGEAVMFLDKPYVVTAECVADSLLIQVPKAVVIEMIEHQPRFARGVIAGLSRRLHQLIRDVESYSLRSGTQRVIGYLLRDHPARGRREPFVVTLRARKGDIASRLSITQEHFSRILHELADAGLIEVRGRDVTIRDPEGLRRYGQ
ncbi:MAG: Crp/Fnr family transcriptional regulator [Pseudomonadota bacterium]